MAASDIYLSGVTPATSGHTARGAAGSPTASASTTTAAWPSGERNIIQHALTLGVPGTAPTSSAPR